MTEHEHSARVPDLHQKLMAPAAEPPFHEELAGVWDRRRGASGEAGVLQRVLVRQGRVLMADGSPRTGDVLSATGMEVVTVPYDELHKNGGVTQGSTMELERRPADWLAEAGR